MFETVQKAQKIKDRFICEIKSSQIVIPDLYALFPGWRFNINNNYESVKINTDKWLESFVESPSHRRSVLAADFSMLAACFYPDSSEEECLMMAYYHLWVFVWDDEIDCGNLTSYPEQALAYWEATDAILDFTLGKEPFSGNSPTVDPVLCAFSVVADKIVTGTSTGSRQRILESLRYYVSAVCVLPLHRLNGNGNIFKIEDFLKQRKYSGGCGTSIALLLYVFHFDIPDCIFNHEALSTIREQSCLIVHLVNDIVSFHKELLDNQLDNIVPILALANECSLQEAINNACDLVREAREVLEDAEKRVPVPTGDGELDKQVTHYIQACKDVAAGNVSWSYHSKRYFGMNPKLEGNHVHLS